MTTIAEILERNHIKPVPRSGVPVDEIDALLEARYHIGQLHDLILRQNTLIETLTGICRQLREKL